MLFFLGAAGVYLSAFIEKYQKTILQTVAMAEMILMPVSVLAVFGGLTSLVTPFIYYRFLSFRYFIAFGICNLQILTACLV